MAQKEYNPFEDDEGLTLERTGELVARGATPPVAGTTAGAIAGRAIGMTSPLALAGSLALPAGDILNTLWNAAVDLVSKDPRYKLALPSDIVSGWLEELGYGRRPSNTTERVIETSSGALASTASQLPSLQNIATEGTTYLGRELAKFASQAPKTQIGISVPSAAAGQYVGEVTESPILGTLASMGTGYIGGINPRIRGNAPTRAEIDARINAEYARASSSGVTLKTDLFNQKMSEIVKELRPLGYSPTNPRFQGIKNMIDEITTNNLPKDINELKAIRNQITASADPTDKDAYRLMKTVRDKFDDYLLNLPENSLVAGDKDSLKSWQTARNLFAKEKKAEIFEEILTNAPISKGQFSQSGMENYLYNELKKLARNKNAMAIFTPDEKDAIRQAAEGSNIQNALKMIGRFAPTSSVPLLSTLGVGAFSPEIASGLAATSLASRKAAELIRVGDINRLVDMMRSGQRQPSMTQNAPTTAVRGLLSQQIVEEELNPFK